MAAAGPLLLYDGECGLCQRSVQFVLAHEADHRVRFATLQGEVAARLRSRLGGVPHDVSSMVFFDGERVHLRSRAVCFLARHLRMPWRFAWYLRFVPAWFGDLAYRLVAAHRYRAFGRAETCLLPDPEQRTRFLD
ncbi:MAG: DUF393 domain-containing protein [Planctomycetes bacterium]|nr:DUF393 domain-containing protein [Planctomycetota bacterium]